MTDEKAPEKGGLMITRRFGEKVIIKHAGETLEFSLQKFTGSQVKIRLNGPMSFDISRGDKLEKGAK